MPVIKVIQFSSFLIFKMLLPGKNKVFLFVVLYMLHSVM